MNENRRLSMAHFAVVNKLASYEESCFERTNVYLFKNRFVICPTICLSTVDYFHSESAIDIDLF